MSRLDRLQISGIRNFGVEEDDFQSIHFKIPLTLFLGQNGSGKTTIIEALKFAITGDLPSGTRSGQGFVHDPKIANHNESRGKVKLRISNTLGQNVTVFKSMSVTRKGDKYEFKRFDSTISKGGKHRSGKCHEIDYEMCTALGVSKPILNNVIFCHQEDSNWPLDEPKKLKEKFDDIFDATKLNKCLETITKARKKNAEKLKILKINVINFNEKKREVDNKKKILSDKKEKVEILQTNIEKIIDDLNPIENSLREIERIEKNHTKLYNEYKVEKNTLISLQEQEREILSIIDIVFTGSDAELNLKISSFEENIDSSQNKISELSSHVDIITKNELKVRESINSDERKLGSLQAKQTQQKMLETQFIKSLNDINKELNLDVVHKSYDSQQTRENLKTINKSIKKFQEQVNICEIEKENQEKDLQVSIDNIREKLAQLKEKTNSKSQLLAQAKCDLNETLQQIQELKFSDNELKSVETKIERVDKEYSALKASCDIESLKKEIEDKKQHYDDLENKLTLISKEIQTLQNYHQIQTEIDLKNENLEKRESELLKLQFKYERHFKHMFPNGIPPEAKLKQKVDNYHKTQSNLTKDLNFKINEINKDIMKYEGKLGTLTEKLKIMETELNSGEEKVKDLCENKEYDAIVNETVENINRHERDSGTYSSSEYLFKKFIEQFKKEEPKCPICKQNVTTKSYAQRIIVDLKEKIKDFPNKLKTANSNKQKNTEKHNKLMALKPIIDTNIKLQEEIPKLKIEVKTLEDILKEKINEVDHLKNNLLEAQKNYDLSSSVICDITLIDEYQKDAINLKNEVELLNAKIPKRESNNSLQETLAKQDSLKIDSRAALNHIESLRSKLSQHTDRMYDIKQQKNDLVSRQLAIKTKLQGKKQLLSKQDEIEKNISNTEYEVQQFNSSIEPLTEKLQRAENDRQKQVSELKNNLTEKKLKLNKPIRMLENLVMSEAQLEEFSNTDVEANIDEVNENLKSQHELLKSFSHKKMVLDNEIDNLNSLIANNKSYYRELQDNVRLREKQKQSEILSKVVSDLKKKIEESNITLKKHQKETLEKNKIMFQRQKDKMEGQISELNESIEDMKKNLALPENAKASMNYKSKVREHKLKDIALHDLLSYGKSLEWALMQFHQQRMKHINSIIRELWRNIYTGNDCDYIEIKTEISPTPGHEKRSTYSYCVVQVRDEVSLEMRGRCSAGQKVLASLIIRIALAETFSNNCGILTLDEPTTNLDKQNITSLSETLVNLVHQKQLVKNFQLVVITHDEDFLKALTKVGLNTYFTVKRNERGRSIVQENIF